MCYGEFIKAYSSVNLDSLESSIQSREISWKEMADDFDCKIRLDDIKYEFE
jgi:hypothetical protein